MKPGDFLQKLDDAQVVRTIQAVERKTSGEIRVFVSNRDLGTEKVVDRAAARFEKLGMTSTRDRNAVLLYFVPRAHQFAIVGDKGIHDKCGDAFWNDVASTIRQKLSAGRFTEAVLDAIEMTGDVLARHFPRRPDDHNELPNEVDRDSPGNGGPTH
jgi:uncharacterized membrane protein